jgi:hypothetical protein
MTSLDATPARPKVEVVHTLTSSGRRNYCGVQQLTDSLQALPFTSATFSDK